MQREQPPPYVDDAGPQLPARMHSSSTTPSDLRGAQPPAGKQAHSSPQLSLSDNAVRPQSRLSDIPQALTPDLNDSRASATVTRLQRDTSATFSDPDDRTAAEALLGLGKAPQQRPQSRESPQQPQPKLTGFETPLQYYPIGIAHTSPGASSQPEPLLALLTSSHPWLGGTLSASSTAYSASKSYSPRFVQYGANLVENTVGTVGRKTGVEGSIRRYLDARQPSSSTNDPSKRIDTKILDPETVRGLTSVTPQPRRKASGTSVDSLPLYDEENRSPAYEEREPPDSHGRQHTELTARPPLPPRSWSTQLMISTSGLGAALNENALRSLKFCLNILNGANRHTRYLLEALKRLLQDFNSSSDRLEEGRPRQTDGDTIMTDEGSADDRPAQIAERIKQLNAEIWNTLKNVVNTVSQYTGGALPENASVVVRWQLMSVPQRWQRAGARTGIEGNGGEEDTVKAGNRMVEFAVEGLDMMDQVGGVVESTICSAERWLDSMGRKKEDGEQGDAGFAHQANEETATGQQLQQWPN